MSVGEFWGRPRNCQCGAKLVQPKRGRTRRWCGASCYTKFRHLPRKRLAERQKRMRALKDRKARIAAAVKALKATQRLLEDIRWALHGDEK